MALSDADLSFNDLGEADACLVGVSPHLGQLKQFIAAQATQTQPLLLIGACGLRQEQIARAIHQLGARAAEPFHSVSVRACHEAALYEALSGHSDVGAGGALFIDDVDGVSNLLHYHIAARIGEQNPPAGNGEPAGARLILSMREDAAATDGVRALFRRSAKGAIPRSFRLSPLRERSEDLPYLAEHLAGQIVRRLGRQAHVFSEAAMEALIEYDWPRNIDELEAALESVIAHTPPPLISENSLPRRIRYATQLEIPAEGIDLPQIVEEYEQSLINQALRQAGGKQNVAAQLLGLRPQTLNMKLKRARDAEPHQCASFDVTSDTGTGASE